MKYVTNRGVRIGYRTYGDGEPLVLLHGWSCEGRYWNEFGYVAELRGMYRLVVPDLRSHGASDTPDDRDFSDKAFASDVLAVLDTLGIESSHFFGYSLGGRIVFEMVATSPLRFRSAIVGGAHPYQEDLSALRAFTTAAIADYWTALQAPLSEASRERLARMDQRLLSDIASDRADLSGRLKGTSVPGLLICGTRDWRFEYARRFAQENARFQFASISDSDHLQAWLQKDQVVPLVREFLSEAEA
jgi:pimeloyl-ACP methyl ester carboxylesterase